MQYFRRVMYQAEGLSRKQMGPLVASSQFKRHPALKPGDRSVEWFVVFWFWVPPGKRDRRNLSTFPSRMTSAKPFELQALGEGEIEEITFNQKFPLDMPKSARDAYLLELWISEYRKQNPISEQSKRAIELFFATQRDKKKP